jgi:hypothetical protein
MAKLYIGERSGPGGGQVGNAQVAHGRKIKGQVLDFSAGHAESAPFTDNTRLLRAYTDAKCSWAVGPAGTVATTSDDPLPADGIEYIDVQAGDIISVIANP